MTIDQPTVVPDEQFDVFERAADIMAKQLAFFRNDCAEPNENDRLTAGHLAGALWANKLLADGEKIETIARMIEGFTADQIRMAAGEMTAQEMRTVRAVQRWWVSAIRHKANEARRSNGE